MPDVTWHPSRVAGSTFPCARGWPAVAREHLCLTCPRCDYGWMTLTADAVTLPQDDDEGDDMPIRKTGAAADQQVTEVSEEELPLQFTASSPSSSSPWSAEDEAGLQEENQEADGGR
jgi:hypothetical protein